MEKSTLFGILTILFYGITTTLYSLRLLKGRLHVHQRDCLWVAMLAVALHTITLYYLVDTPTGQNLSLVNVASLITWIATLFITIAMIRLPLENLVLLMHPLALLGIVAALFFPERHTIPTRLFPLELGHILLSIVGNGLLLIAAIQALLIALQERLLRQAPTKPLAQVFPPIQMMEKLLFAFIWAGFVVLTLALVSGLFAWKTHTPDSVVYKLAFSLFAWFVFGVLLWGRKQFGWRGSKMVRTTLLGTITLIIAYAISTYRLPPIIF